VTTKVSLVTPEKEFHYFAQTVKGYEFSDIGTHHGFPHQCTQIYFTNRATPSRQNVKLRRKRKIEKRQFVDYKRARNAVKFLATGLQSGGSQSVPDA
jgi:hypothetical protein